jgi:hypothetical protein
MNTIKSEDYKKFYSRYYIQSQTQSNSRVYVNTTHRYDSKYNYSDELGIQNTEVKQLYEITLFEEGLKQMVCDTTEYHELMRWINTDPTARRVFEQYKIIKLLKE